MAAGGSDQAKQQKMMMYIMPVMMLFIFYNMPSGLNLYIMTSTFAGVAEQKIIRKHIRQREEAEAARETTVSVPGKKPRSQRPKKPKGPNWFKQG
jgi:membrane protein insertase Oxa1/YidC/SpoIIIJ